MINSIMNATPNPLIARRLSRMFVDAGLSEITEERFKLVLNYEDLMMVTKNLLLQPFPEYEEIMKELALHKSNQTIGSLDMIVVSGVKMADVA